MEHTNRTIRPLTQQDLEPIWTSTSTPTRPIKRWTKRAGSTTGRSTVWRLREDRSGADGGPV